MGDSYDEKVGGMNIVLASQSPRRREMLAWLGVPFVAASAQVDETPQNGEAPRALVVRLAQSKARALQDTAGAYVLAADTIVVLGNGVLGKPRDANEAREMLIALRAQPHQVLTAITLHYPDGEVTRVVEAQVRMRAYTLAELEAYIATGDPMDKAGAYAIQHPDFSPVSHVDVCYATVVGLPLCAVKAALNAAGVEVRSHIPTLCLRHFGYHCPRVDEGDVA